MPVDSTHAEYDATLPAWRRARDVIAGEDAVKARGEAYLPRLSEQSDAEYLVYKTRASFFCATGRTLEALVGLIMRSDYTLTLPAEGSPLGKVMRAFTKDVDLGGMTLAAYVKRLVTEVVAVGRCGTLVDWEGTYEDRAALVFYKAEQITNWRYERVNGRRTLTLVVLSELAAAHGVDPDPFVVKLVPQLRVLRLSASRTGDGAGGQRQCVVEVWQQLEVGEGNREWTLVESSVPLRAGVPLPYLPFIFHGPGPSCGEVPQLPLAHLISVNLDHYRLDADFKHGLHFTALPTAYVSGVELKVPLRIGSSTAWQLDGKEARVGFLEFTGQGLTTFERAMDHDERLMAVVGTRMLEGQKRAYESAQSIELRQSAEQSALVTIALSVSESLTEVLRWVAWWSSGVASFADLGEGTFLISVNHDFNPVPLAGPDLTALVAAWKAGAISRDSMLEVLRRGELLPVGRTNEEETRMAEAEFAKLQEAAQPAPALAA